MNSSLIKTVKVTQKNGALTVGVKGQDISEKS